MTTPYSSSAWVEGVDLDHFLRAAAHLARTCGADLLLSGPAEATGRPGETRSLVALAPVDELLVGSHTRADEIKRFCFSGPGPALGYLSYEYGMRRMGVVPTKRAELPDGHFKRYAALVEHDSADCRCRVRGNGATRVAELAALLRDPPPLSASLCPTLGPGPHVASLSREQYEATVERVLGLIRAGDCYQLNLSIRFDQPAPNLDALELFMGLLSRSPASFYAWFRSQTRTILSTSPERFMSIEQGRVRSEPIKGTRRLGPGEDEAMARQVLAASPKEDAELSMIVDLIRNDISAHCVPGTVAVVKHKDIFVVDDLLQMYSVVTGELAPGSDCLDLLLAALPGGSVTGCPKRRAMERIDELEPHARGVYCGSFVLVEDEQTLDSSICIRTAVHDAVRRVLTTYAGSGIVVDSDPRAEYGETMAKADKFLRLGGEG